MAREEFTGVTFNDFEPPGTQISRSSKFSIVNITEIEIALNIAYRRKHMFSESEDYRQDITLYYTRNVDNNPQRYATRFS